jgi:hypothetical protein
MPGVFDEIRAACAGVAERARHVRIHSESLDRLAAVLAEDPPPAPGLDPAHHALADPERTLAYVVTLDAINFGSGWFPVLRKRPGLSGYFTIATSLKDRFERDGPWTAEELGGLTAGDCAEVFAQEPGGAAAELMDHFARALRDLGGLLALRFDGSFPALIAAAGGSAAALTGILREMPCYRDVARHDVHAAFQGEGPGSFEDLDALTIFADNLVPHVLRREGVLRYAPDLAARIDREERLVAGSAEEVEIRACAVHAVECCVAAIRRAGKPATAQRLDYWLWNRGQLPEMKAHPRHRARTVYY